jgi:hypothetical protein
VRSAPSGGERGQQSVAPAIFLLAKPFAARYVKQGEKAGAPVFNR